MPPHAVAAAVVHLALAAFLTGLIWVIQLVHYPLMRQISPERFIAYQREHMARITWIVAPMMVLEAASAASLVFILQETLDRVLGWIGVALVVVIWASTAILQAPAHSRLAEDGYNAELIRRLVATNWIRTVAWSIRLLLAAALCVRVASRMM